MQTTPTDPNLDRAAQLVCGYDWKTFVRELIDDASAEFFPTLAPHAGKSKRVRELNAAQVVLADAYDAEMVRRGDSRRAWRESRS